MMSKIGQVCLIVTVFLILLFSFLSFSKTENIVYVNTALLLEKYQGMEDARNAYDLKVKDWQANVDTLAQELEAELKKYEQERAKMSKKERKLTEELLTKKQQDLLRYRDATQQKAQEEDRKMTENILNEVNNFMLSYGKEQSYDIILGTTSGGSIMYAKDALDITEEVVVKLNEQYIGN